MEAREVRFCGTAVTGCTLGTELRPSLRAVHAHSCRAMSSARVLLYCPILLREISRVNSSGITLSDFLYILKRCGFYI